MAFSSGELLPLEVRFLVGVVSSGVLPSSLFTSISDAPLAVSSVALDLVDIVDVVIAVVLQRFWCGSFAEASSTCMKIVHNMLNICKSELSRK